MQIDLREKPLQPTWVRHKKRIGVKCVGFVGEPECGWSGYRYVDVVTHSVKIHESQAQLATEKIKGVFSQPCCPKCKARVKFTHFSEKT